jgi:enterochelin esterase-like enzyme
MEGPSRDPRTGALTFVAADDPHARPERVWYHLRSFGDDPTFHRDGDDWVATVPAPPVDRLEYLFVVRAPDGTESMVLDPTNPASVAGVFGDHSVLELPGYQPPAWLSHTSEPWSAQPVAVEARDAGLAVRGEVLTPPGSTPTDPLPLLVVHDGPEYVRLARLLDLLDWSATGDAGVRCRVLALQPVDRDRAYAASAAYTDALVRHALPAVRDLATTTGPLVGLGASLGALALAYAQATHPGTFAGLMFQSGSFFLPRFDAHEVRFSGYQAVVAATAGLHADPSPLAGTVVRLTAGLGEENLDNNRALADRLAGLDVDAELAVGRDGHSYTAWRDLLDPALPRLLARCWHGVTTGTG